MATNFQNGLGVQVVQATPEQVAAIAAMSAAPAGKVLASVVLVYAGEAEVSHEENEGSEGGTFNIQHGTGIKEMLAGIHQEIAAIRNEFRANKELADAVVTENVARQAFALVKAMESERGMRKAPVMTVFRLYCIEGLSASEVATKCRCSKASVINRLEMIRRRTGTTPEKLRAYSAQFEEIERTVEDPRARRIYRKGVIQGDSEEETDEDTSF